MDLVENSPLASSMPFRVFLLVTTCVAAFVAGRADAGGGTLVIVFPAELREAAEEWAAYRTETGWDVVLEPAPTTGDVAAVRLNVQSRIRLALRPERAEQPRPREPYAVLLLGDACDSNLPAGARPRGIPAWRVPQRDPVLVDQRDPDFATDHPYQLLDDADDLPDVMLGRIPARNVDEARIVLEKIQRYEQHPPRGEWKRRVTYIAGEGRFGPADQLLEELFRTMVDRMVPPAFDISMTYANPLSVYCPPPMALVDVSLRRLGEGALLFNYIGHGHAEGFDRLEWDNKRWPILRTGDLARLAADEGRGLPIALLTCCSTGWYDLPRESGKVSLAEAMMLHPSGPIAVIAGSRPTHPYANTIIQKNITTALLDRRASTIGEMDLWATRAMTKRDAADLEIDALAYPIALAGRWKVGLNELRSMHMSLYNLFGDPATAIPHPVSSVNNLVFIRDASEKERWTILGHIPGMKRGGAVITIETARTSSVRESEIEFVTDAADAQLPHKTERNYAIVNERVLHRVEGTVTEGRLEARFAGTPSSRAAVLKVVALGENEQGEPIDAIGAIPLIPLADQR